MVDILLRGLNTTSYAATGAILDIHMARRGIPSMEEILTMMTLLTDGIEIQQYQ